MGLAGHYFIRDSNRDCLVPASQLPALFPETPVCIQDRRFTTASEIVDQPPTRPICRVRR